MNDTTKDSVKMRKWPAGVIIMGAIIGILVVRNLESTSYQMKNMTTIMICLGSLLLMGVWWGLFSRLSWKTKFKGYGVAGLVMVLLMVFVKIEGVTGDFAPYFSFRFSQPVDRQIAIKDKVEVVKDVVLPKGYVKDYADFLGPNRVPVIRDMKLKSDWGSYPPKKVWSQAIGKGWSGMVVKGGRVVTVEQRGDEEMVSCYALVDGKLLWSVREAFRYSSTIAGDGPRSTPTIDGELVYALGSSGKLKCIQLVDGLMLWEVQVSEGISNDAVPEELKGSAPMWGNSCSPLVVDEMVVLMGYPAPTLRAYDKKSGEVVWTAGKMKMSYASPMVATLGGVRQLVIKSQQVVTGHGLEDGKELWRYDWAGKFPKVAMPVVLPGDEVFISSGYGVGAQVIKLSKGEDEQFSATSKWATKSMRMKAKFANVIYKDGYIYGLDDGVIACIDVKDGSRKWKANRVGHGQMILVGEDLVITGDAGDVFCVKARPDQYELNGQFMGVSGKTWNPPALAGQYLLLRSDEEIACYELAIEK